MVRSYDNVDKNLFIEEWEPSSVYEKLIEDEFCYLIDVRSKPEWSFVGFPDSKDMKNEVIFCEWAFFPVMERNPNFESDIFSNLNFNKCKNLYFICRSGSRSLHAANLIQYSINQKLEFNDNINCINVKFGFEGDLSNENRRGSLNGWKFSDLPWKQL